MKILIFMLLKLQGWISDFMNLLHLKSSVFFFFFLRRKFKNGKKIYRVLQPLFKTFVSSWAERFKMLFWVIQVIIRGLALGIFWNIYLLK